MPHVEATASVPLDARTAFDIANGLGAMRVAWDPTLDRRFLVRGATELAPGAVVFAREPGGRRFLLEVETWFPGVASSARMIKGPVYLREYGEGWRFHADEGGTTRATFKLSFKAASPVAAETIGAALRPPFEELAEARVEAFARACRDERLVDAVRRGERSPESLHSEVSEHEAR